MKRALASSLSSSSAACGHHHLLRRRRPGDLPARVLQQGFFSSPFAAPTPTRLVERRRLQVPADKLYGVVIDVDTYKSFLPFCASSTVTRRLGGDCFEAELLIGFEAFSAGYRSRVTHRPPEPFRLAAAAAEQGGGIGVTGGGEAQIVAKSVDSPIFTTMDSHWLITPVPPSPEQQRQLLEKEGDGAATFGSACDVEFCIEFDMGGNAMLASTVNALLEDVSAQQIEAFDVRARSLSR